LRTHKVLAAVAERPGANNRQVGVAAGVSDQGQMSRLLARLEGLGLLENRGTRELGAPYAWHLTSRGEEILSASQPTSQPNNPITHNLMNTTTKENR
jgi:DNA-binding MarR family transcriptional regulator